MGYRERLGWPKVSAIAADGDWVIGLRDDKSIVVADTWLGEDIIHSDQYEDFKDIVQVAVAHSAWFALTDDGRVIASTDRGNNVVSEWTDICKITAADNYVAGLKEDGTILAVRYIGSSKCGVLSLSKDGELVVDRTYKAFKTGQWEMIDDNMYYFTKDGTIATGWTEIEGVMTYFDEKGIMQTGLQKIDGKTYYLGETGTIHTGDWMVDGAWRHFDENGVQTEMIPVSE